MVPIPFEARLLSDVRKSVAKMMKLSIHSTEPEALLNRYAELSYQASWLEEVAP